ncbi:SRPBCC family protein [Parvularcula dongshanensis]|uniref:Coenzyme Q-binding protein COQ10 n=1 Tax=Parvularcula dongshanensis TaxID=1173995 RepID=A0A840I475_9PROT|nr:coenzyme Q-binding protein COQ10 [Parvularcula dongshanensis]
MPAHHERRALPYTPEQMFDLVADVRDYPRFIPWIEALRVREEAVTDGTGRLLADMVVGYKMFRETMRSEVRLDRGARTIGVDYVRGPLKRLTNDWRFEEDGAGCVVDFRIDFAFKNRLMEAAAGQLMQRGFLKLVEAFEAEAARRYG